MADSKEQQAKARKTGDRQIMVDGEVQRFSRLRFQLRRAKGFRVKSSRLNPG